jgi:hypothetical protein
VRCKQANLPDIAVFCLPHAVYLTPRLYRSALADFIKWNLTVGSNCNSMQANVNICVSIIGGSTTPTPTTTAGNSTEMLQPTQPGQFLIPREYLALRELSLTWDKHSHVLQEIPLSRNRRGLQPVNELQPHQPRRLCQVEPRC